MIRARLTDDITWDLPRNRHHGKAEFDGEMDNEEFVGSPTLTAIGAFSMTTSQSEELHAALHGSTRGPWGHHSGGSR